MKIPLLIVSLLLSPSVFAYSASHVTTAINDTVKSKLISRGFSVNDPRYYSTLTDISKSSASIAQSSSALRLGTATGRSWMSTMLRGALVGRGKLIALAASGALAWYFMDESTVQVKVYDPSKEVGVKGFYWQYSTYVNSTLAEALAELCTRNSNLCKAYEIHSYERDNTREDLRTVVIYSDTNKKNVWQTSTAQLINCSNSSKAIASCQENYSPATDQYTVTSLPIQQAIDGISQTELDTPLSPEVTAEIANNIWQSASPQTYPASDPITAADVSAASSSKPTVGDFIQPDAAFTGELPAESVPSSGDNAVIGTDPKISPPELSNIPTGRDILAPLFSLMPFLQNYDIPVRAAQCPTYSFEWNNRTFTVDAHCTLLERFRTLIQLFASVLWSFSALRIILSA
ncbi:hypothetical protein H4F45_05000 [Pectobacterium brasiliense]|uniref:Toxin co-regulated pilus biosynthesis protein Q C-terminal domain-containing protein n=1 Tax=Pectobacterium brasiliense TaxID=180957 RepID=A0AAE2WCK7_9GAMM|nr:hypothetical protein [Pectobacterium brasiliense]MBN3050847.1 hypothetical protein [Pectobacterium brasiliense]